MAVRVVEQPFGEWLKQHREAIPMTQQELAAELDVSVRALQTYEYGECLPRPARRRAIVAYFDSEWAA
jgi:transcriptional regulator with XRE-family HTH domain